MKFADNVEWWRAQWRDTVRRVQLVEPGLDFAAPSYVLQDLIDELRLTRLEHGATREVYAELAKRSKSRPVVKERFAVEFRLICESLAKWKGWQHALNQAQRAEAAISAGYGALAAACLADLVERKPWDAKVQQELKELTNDMIVELLVRGHSLKFVADIPWQLLDHYERKSERVTTRYPHGLDERAENLHEELTRMMDALSARDRLLRVAYYFERQSQRVRYVFQLRGLRLLESVELGDVTLYNPLEAKRVVADQRIKLDETFGQEVDTVAPYPNIAVLLECDPRDAEDARQRAAQLASRSLDLIKPHIRATSTLRVVSDSCITTDEAWRYHAGWSSNRNNEGMNQLLHAPDVPSPGSGDRLQEAFASVGQGFLVAPGTASQQRLSQALHIARRGKEAKRADDKLTHHWVVIETLLPLGAWRGSGAIKQDETILALSRRVVPSLFVRRSLVYSVGWELHRLLSSLVALSIEGPQLVLPESLWERCQLDPEPPREVQLRPIIDALPDVAAEASVKAQPWLLAQVESTIAFYSQPSEAHKRLTACLRACSAFLERIYRARNRVVHDAVTHGALFESLSEYAADLSDVLLLEAIRSANKVDLADALLAIEAQVDEVVARLDANQAVDLIALVEPS